MIAAPREVTDMLYRVLRKLKLGKCTYQLLYPFRGKASALPGPNEARVLLESVSPDTGGSCLCVRRVKGAVREGELDIIIPAYNAENICASVWTLCLTSRRSIASECSL